MTYAVDATHNPHLRSWVESANAPDAEFPLQNLPFCVFSRRGVWGGGVGIGDRIVDLEALATAGLLQGDALIAAQAASGASLNPLMALDASFSNALRHSLSALLGSQGRDQAKDHAEKFLRPMQGAAYAVPARIGGFTDFLTSRHHTERHGRFKGLKDPLPPAFFSLPVAYHGRTSSIRVSGTDVRRPRGQLRDASGVISFAPAQALDFELELGAYIRSGNELAQPVPLAAAEEKLFGYTLLNDWSAKDIQWWEQVLGPFLGKNFMTSVSPWVVTSEALAPFRCAAPSRPATDPALLPHLHDDGDQRMGGLDIEMEAWISTAQMRASGAGRFLLSRTTPRNLYWTFGQMLAHHTSNGCNMEAGDLIGSGTISGEEFGSRACMTEIAEAGKKPIAINAQESRSWLQDGDEICFRGHARREGFVSIGFGECRGTICTAQA